MSRTIQTLTLGVALGAAGLAGATFVGRAEAERAVQPADRGIAFVDVFGLVDAIVMSEEPTAARVEFEAQVQQQAETLQARNREIQEQAQLADPDSPDIQTLSIEFQQNNQALQNLFQTYQQDLQTLIAGQIADAYKKVYDATRAVAAAESVHFVFATRPGADLEQVDSITGVAQEILARPLIAPPEALDLTAKVREKLNLSAPAPRDGSAPDAGTDAGGESGD